MRSLPLVALLSAAAAQGAVTLSYELTTNNGMWPSAPAGFTTSSAENLLAAYAGQNFGRQGYGFYDAFRINLQGEANATVSGLTLSFRFSGLFDDTVAFDLNGDGAIDYTVSYYDVVNAAPGWAPWVSPQDSANLGIVLSIGTSVTTAQAYIYGSLVPTGGLGYYNNLSSITLASLGLASLDANGAASSTGSIRIGFLNAGGGSNTVVGGGGTPTLSTSNFGFDPNQTYAVPEPSTYGLALGGLALAVVAARRRLKK